MLLISDYVFRLQAKTKYLLHHNLKFLWDHVRKLMQELSTTDATVLLHSMALLLSCQRRRLWHHRGVAEEDVGLLLLIIPLFVGPRIPVTCSMIARDIFSSLFFAGDHSTFAFTTPGLFLRQIVCQNVRDFCGCASFCGCTSFYGCAGSASGPADCASVCASFCVCAGSASGPADCASVYASVCGCASSGSDSAVYRIQNSIPSR